MKKIISVVTILLLMTQTGICQKSINIITNSDNIPLSTITLDSANKIFSEMKTSNLFNMADCNNCEDRANAIGYILSKRGYKVAKFWLFGEGKISLCNQLYLLKSSKCGTWGYHVAIGLLTETNGVKDTVILDPATQTSAVSLNNWALPLIQNNRVGYLAIKDIIYYSYPVSGNKFQANDTWTATDIDLWKTSCGLCGFKPKQCGKKRFAERIRNKQIEIKAIN